MNYSEIIRALDAASPFELYRLNVAIGNMLDDPQRMALIKKQLRAGDRVAVFDSEGNQTLYARILKVQRTRALVELENSGRKWLYPFYMLNLQDGEVAIENPNRQAGLTRNEISIGDTLGFCTREGEELYGQVLKLNPKTVKLQVGEVIWRVAYEWLFKVLEPGQAEFLPARQD